MILQVIYNDFWKKVVRVLEDNRCRKLSPKYKINGYKRILFVHIRKTGGTSINNMFLDISGNSSAMYAKMAKKNNHRVVSNRKVYIGWNKQLINRGEYFYAFSHAPFYKLHLPSETFSFTCFRDPVQRVISHYNMLLNYRENEIQHQCMTVEGHWLGDSFRYFLEKIPKEHLCNQLYKFSESFNIDEAVERVSSLSHYFFLERFKHGIDGINVKTGLNLSPLHIRKAGVKNTVSQGDISFLKEMVEEEYLFLNKIRKDNGQS